jgi:hypothetical protein
MDLLRKSGVNLEYLPCLMLNLEESFPLEGEQAVRPYANVWIT